jgi:hypothetical protein
MTSEDLALLLVILILLQCYFMRRFYLQSKVLRLEFSLFIRHTSFQIEELTSAAKDTIIEQAQLINTDLPKKDAEKFVPDVLTEANKTYWDEVEQVQKVLLRNGIKRLSLQDLQFGLSGDLK